MNIFVCGVFISLGCAVHLVDAAKDFGDPIFIGIVVSYVFTILILSIIYGLVIKPYFKTHRLPPECTGERPDRIFYTSDTPVPKYWKNKKGYPVWIDITNTADGQIIKRVVYNLWKEDAVGVGRDASATDNKFIKIKRIQRVENGALFEKYDKYRKLMERKENIIGGFPDPVQMSSPILSTSVIERIGGDSVLENEVHHNVHEHYLFHGTKLQNLVDICDGGLKIAHASKGLFGKGIYFAEDPTKSEQYTDEGDTKKILLLMRVCLGERYVLKSKHGNVSSLTSPPCRKCYTPCCTTHNYKFDSAVADIPNYRFREFIIYNDGRSYPEYIITYNRVRTRQYVV